MYNRKHHDNIFYSKIRPCMSKCFQLMYNSHTVMCEYKFERERERKRERERDRQRERLLDSSYTCILIHITSSKYCHEQYKL